MSARLPSVGVCPSCGYRPTVDSEESGPFHTENRLEESNTSRAGLAMIQLVTGPRDMTGRPRDPVYSKLCFLSYCGNFYTGAMVNSVPTWLSLTRDFPHTPDSVLPSASSLLQFQSFPRFKNRTGRSTCRARRNSATFFPNTSTVVVTPTPRSSRLRNKKCTAFSPGSSNLSIANCACARPLSPRSSRAVSTDNNVRSQRYSSRWRTQKPQLESAPLSPERACTTHPSGPRVVGPKSWAKSTGRSR